MGIRSKMKGKKKWLILLVALLGAAALPEVGLLPPVLTEVTDAVLDELAPLQEAEAPPHPKHSVW